MLPWADMWLAAQRIGIPTTAFWQLSVREWLWLSGQLTSSLQRAELTTLMEAFPDE